MSKTKLSVHGMHCSSCAAIIQREISKVPGVEDVVVNFASEKAIITHEGVDADNLVAAVKKAGYSAELEKRAESDNKKNQEINRLFRKFFISLLLSLPMLYFMILDFFPQLPGGDTLPPYFAIISLI